ncbi:MAG TPA: hypothetical protein VHZ24_01310 [Pirellulales bacterium]|jgi:hypothetical protein|nr:hypothetical protein [Pirellulales bacterium]
MTWIDTTIDELAAAEAWSYRAGATPATEPTALAALTLGVHGRTEAAERASRWLVEYQNVDGSLGINADQDAPHWPTSLAVLAWCAADAAANGSPRYSENIARATRWIDSVGGKPAERTADLGHDTTLIGWPWVEGTHSWMEPTAWCVLALKASGQGEHPRTREAVRLLIDRLLPEGGANYGNTWVLGQLLRPHLEPTGVALLALAGEEDQDGRIAKSRAWLASGLGPTTTAASLAYGLMGLAASDEVPRQADRWLADAAVQTRTLVGYQPRLTLLTLAALGAECPLITLPRQKVHG